MTQNSVIQHRVKHFELLLARELSFIEREHSQNLITHQKLENSIRRTNNSSLNNNRTKICLPPDSIHNEQTESVDCYKIRTNNNSNRKHRLSIGTITSITQNQTEELFDDSSSSFISSRRRRYCTKGQRLPPIVKANISNRQNRENKNPHWIASFQQLNTSKENINEPFTILNDESSKPILPELTPIQRQVRSFLETLPTYKGVQRGFDSFAPASLYSNRAPVAIR